MLALDILHNKFIKKVLRERRNIYIQKSYGTLYRKAPNFNFGSYLENLKKRFLETTNQH